MWSLLDIKRLIALATVQEMNMIMIFLFLLSNTNYTILNSFLLIHGLLSVFLFFLVDVVYKQAQTRNLTVLGGLGLSSPHLLIFV
jgi:NADH:ubiquinone oxidoreductase subunit 4 (subunit M)